MLWSKKKAEDESAAAEDRPTRLSERLAARLPRRGAEGKRRKPWSKKRIVVTVLAAVLLIASCAGVYMLFFAQEERIALTGATTYGALNEAIEGSGTTTPADSVTYEISGTVLEWYVEAGQEVKTGDLLYVLDSSEAEDEKLEYEVELEELYEQRSEIQESIARTSRNWRRIGAIRSRIPAQSVPRSSGAISMAASPFSMADSSRIPPTRSLRRPTSSTMVSQ